MIRPSSKPRRTPAWLDRLNTISTTVLVDRIPQSFDWLLQWLSRRQLVLMMICLLWICIPLITIRPTFWQQGMVALLMIGVGRFLLTLEERHPQGRISEYLHLLLVCLSVLVTLRYFYYRTAYTLNLDSWLNTFFSLLLYFAELYGIATLMLAYFQTAQLQTRKPIDLKQFPQEQWFTVDVFIPTYNENVEIVRKTVLGALAIDYPADKKRVYVLDDGRKFPERREEIRHMCEELGCTMLTRENNDHAKAGNINTAFQKTSGDLILILDCDHIPSRTFLKETVGFFFKEKVALVQTPHWFYNPDPFERNLRTGGRVPVSNELFYKVLQKGNDFWNAAFFCGSAAVIRRKHVLEVGGIATETVTEDCHTALRLHSKGYETVYYDKIMVAGLAPEKFSSYVGQQVRWARGMAQILRLENPLFNPKLKLSIGQRLCYLSATSHFFFGFPRLMYAVAPTLFLLFGINSVRGLGLETLFYALPHIVLSMQTNHIRYKHVRFSFWNEIYEFAMSFQAGIVTILAMINPRLGSFNVTDKGLSVTKRNFDLESIRYLVILGAITGASLLAVPFWLLLSPRDTEAVLINSLWCTFNLLLVVAACLAAFEQPQLRRSHRLPRQIDAIIHSDDHRWAGKTVNVSESGTLVVLDSWPNIPDQVRVELVGDFGARALLDAEIVRGIATEKLQTLLAIDFINVSRTQLDDLSVVIYSDVKEWYSQKRVEVDKPLDSLRFISTSLRRAFREFRPEVGVKVRKQVDAIAHLYWEGWEGQSYTARVTEMGMRDLRLEIVGDAVAELDMIRITQPLIALSMGQTNTDPYTYSLLAQVQMVEEFAMIPASSTYDLSHRVAMELRFPEFLDRQQKDKIRRILRSLD
ncbi:cellulose synthase catalytic subunit (UDP-forming) [filamentous cyanobacterium CCP2]|nr:cellulose synthase catalytic subunit (UDP-forming) [filamentous cyanobacterium CCP2]